MRFPTQCYLVKQVTTTNRFLAASALNGRRAIDHKQFSKIQMHDILILWQQHTNPKFKNKIDNTIEFLCSHIHRTTTTHIPFQTRFCLLVYWIKWKLSKLIIRLLCWTDKIPTHLKHKAQTRSTCSHSKKRCWHDSSLVWQRLHTVVFKSWSYGV